MRRALVSAVVIGSVVFFAATDLLARAGEVLIALDAPATTTVTQGFTLRGVTTGGADVVHVWAFPAGRSPVFLGWALTNQPDAARRLTTGAFQLRIDDAPIGTYPIVVYAHDPATGGFAETGRVFTVAPYSFITHCSVFYGIRGVAHVVCTG